MPKMYAIVTMVGGAPDTGALIAGQDFNGFVHCGSLGQYGAYIFSGSGAQLIALDALATVVGLAAMTEAGAVKWPELDNTIAAGKRTKLNNWLTARGYANVPVGWTYRQAVMAIWIRFHAAFRIEENDVAE